MNIFFTDACPVIAAQNQCGKLLIKMILEQAQLLSTAHRLIDGELYTDVISGRKKSAWLLADAEMDKTLYRSTHANHPSAVWLRESSDNYTWGYKHFVAMCEEYTYRFDKVHKCETVLRKELAKLPVAITKGKITLFVKCMGASPESLAIEDPIEAYRHFYQTKQKRFEMTWTKREKPTWFEYTT